MTYAQHHPVRLIGGRLALDFLNTADWSDTGEVFHEKIETRDDLNVWLGAVGIPDAPCPATIADLHTFRSRLRGAFLSGQTDPKVAGDLQAALHGITLEGTDLSQATQSLPALSLIAASAVALIGDPRELKRIKLCPGNDCGWLFLDETKNGRRKWCMMETCGNRAKASRNYSRKVADRKST